MELTRTEFDLLAVMCANPRQVFSRRQLIDAVWGPDWFGDEHLVDVHVGHVRRKLGDDAAEPRWIRTVRGVGYGMVVWSRPRSLAVRMMAGQIVVIAVGAITLAITAALIAPRLFTYHFEQTGEANSMVQYHAQEAFNLRLHLRWLSA